MESEKIKEILENRKKWLKGSMDGIREDPCLNQVMEVIQKMPAKKEGGNEKLGEV